VCLSRQPLLAAGPVCLAPGGSPAPEILRWRGGEFILQKKTPRHPPPPYLAFESAGALWFEAALLLQESCGLPSRLDDSRRVRALPKLDRGQSGQFFFPEKDALSAI